MAQSAKALPGVFKRMLMSLLFIVGAAYLGLMVLLFFLQKNIIFHPSKEVSATPEMIRLNYEDCFFKTADDITLNGWFVPKKGAVYTILFCHGNAGNIGNRLDTIEQFHDMGFSVFLFDYREYGKSQGTLSEKGLYHDADAAWNYLTEQKKVKPNDIIVVGRSLGGSLASYLAATKQPKALITECAFSSVADVGRALYPFLPVGLLVRYQLNTAEFLKKATCPKLILHSEEDEIIPYKLGVKNSKVASSPKTFVTLNGGHNDCYFSDERYRKSIEEFVAALPK